MMDLGVSMLRGTLKNAGQHGGPNASYNLKSNVNLQYSTARQTTTKPGDAAPKHRTM